MLNHLNDPGVREAMLAEVVLDLESDSLTTSKYHTETGASAWSDLLKETIQSHDLEWLIQQSSNPEFWKATHERRKPSGGFTEAKVPVTAPITFATGEFLRFYDRALAVIAIDTGRSLRVARLLDVANPRSSSEEKIGTTVDAQALLDDLRENQGIDTFLGIPAGPNSGLGVELV